jgi:hypothetical protein
VLKSGIELPSSTKRQLTPAASAFSSSVKTFSGNLVVQSVLAVVAGGMLSMLPARTERAPQ